MRAIGLMSGTSMDGIDVALVDTDGDRQLTLGAADSVAYEEADRTLLRQALAEATSLTDRTSRPGVLAEAERRVTVLHAAAVETFLDRHGIERGSIDLVGFHGQTVLHRPEARLTVQIGDAPALAARLGLVVVADLRAADVEAGGQGAPLVPVFHQALAEVGALPLPALFINIGGVANITYVAADADPIACDTGPGNALIDDLMVERMNAPCDRDGMMAMRGRVNEAALAQLLANPFFAAPLPKSLDRNAFSRTPVDGLETTDAAATLTAFTAATIAKILDHLPGSPAAAVVCGGGARNPALMTALSLRLPCRVSPAEAFGWRADAIEAQAFAYLAVRAHRGLPLTFPSTTGVPRPLSGGRIVHP